MLLQALDIYRRSTFHCLTLHYILNACSNTAPEPAKALLKIQKHPETLMQGGETITMTNTLTECNDLIIFFNEKGHVICNL